MTTEYRPCTIIDIMTPTELTALRQQLGRTQQQLAALIGVSRGTIACWESGTHRIPTPVALLLARLMKERPQ